MGAVGPRHLVSLRGLEFTVGIKYETNIIILFASLFIQLLSFAQRQDKEGLIAQVGASEWFNYSFMASGSRVFLFIYLFYAVLFKKQNEYIVVFFFFLKNPFRVFSVKFNLR